MSNIMDSISSILREELAPSIFEFQAQVDPVFSTAIMDSQGVMRDDIGKDWTWKQPLVTGLAGGFVDVEATGDSILTVQQQTVGYDTQSTWPGRTDMVNPALSQRSLKLKRQRGNFAVPLQVLRADKLTAARVSYFAQILKAVVKHQAQREANFFYSYDATNPTYFPLGTITVTAGGGAGDTSVTFTVLTGRIRRYMPGMPVDFYNPTGPAKRNTPAMKVGEVDLLNKTVKAYTTDGAGITGTITTGDFVANRSTTASAGPAGIENYIKASGTLFNGSVSLTSYPELKSIVVASLGSALDELALNKYIGSFFDAYDTNLDTILTTVGVINGYIDNLSDFRQVQRNGEVLTLKEGWASISYEYEGRRFKFLVSPYCASGNLYVAKQGGQNFRRLVPPKLSEAGSRKEFPGDIEFVAPIFGFKNVFMPLLESSQIGDLMQAPFDLHRNWFYDDPRGIKIGGITEVTA